MAYRLFNTEHLSGQMLAFYKLNASKNRNESKISI